jgi:uroporphyrinogen-III decarboxylase
MTKKERVIAAIERKPVDRLPTTFRASNYIATAIMKHFSLQDPDDPSKNRKKLLELLGADYWSSGTKLDKFSTFSPVFKGEKPKPPYIEDRNNFYMIGINSKAANMNSYDIDYPHVGVDPPLAAVSSSDDLKKDFLMSKLVNFDFSTLKNGYSGIYLSEFDKLSDGIVNFGTLSNVFYICCYLRGMEQFLTDMAFDQKLVARLVGEVGEFCMEFNRRMLEAMGDEADYYGTWDDFAGQDGLLFSPDLFNKYFLPIYKKLIETIKGRGIYFGFHCCGSVHGILPQMIDAGIDVFDVVQTSAREMEIENVFRLYGKDVCLHGGLDVQKLLVEKTAPEIREEVKKIKDLWGTRGGMILAPSHETLPDTPVENVLAIYETILED